MKSATHSERRNRRATDGSNALNTSSNGNKPFDVHTSKGLIPFRWQRKTGRAASLVESFYHAFHGIKVGLKEQRNLRIHFMAAPCVVILGVIFQIDIVSWLALVFVMGLVISTEFMNTAIEHLVDISAEGQYKYAARCAKDTAASAVLTASIVAIIVGLLVFVPRIIELIK